ncbi:hypothetical protein [Paenibacillus paridis]|uniref:hypothetical protein n=1 Tax=Paenibacillus paridis TaxID=2583376 RepID=UPI00112206CB|nr:hypothetical protein [Paenibacillus paridis]
MPYTKLTSTEKKKIKKRLTLLIKKEKELSVQVKNYEKAIKFTCEKSGCFTEEMNTNIKNSIVSHLHRKSKLERKLIPLKFQISILKSKLKLEHNEIFVNDMFEEVIDHFNSTLEKYVVDDFPAMQLHYDQESKDFWF